MAYDDEAFNNALIQAGIGMMSGRGNAWEKLAQGFQGGMYGYSETLSAREKKKLQEAKLEEERQQAEQRKLAMQKAQLDMERMSRLNAIYTGGGAPQSPQSATSDAPGWARETMPPPPAQAPQQKKSVAQMLLEAGFVDEAKKAAEAENIVGGGGLYGKVDPKDYTPASVRKFQQTRNYADLVPRDEIISDDLGGKRTYRTKYDITPVGEAGKTMTPAEIDNAMRDRVRLALEGKRVNMEGERLSRDRNQYDIERGGVVNLDTREFKPVTQGGTALPPKMSDKQKGELSDLDGQLAVVRGGIDAAERTPSAFSGKRGLATMAGSVAESAASRFDSSQERQDRAYVYNAVSKVINERAGAAQSAQEMARLRSFLPAETDNAAQIQDKFKGFEQYLLDLRGAKSQAPGPNAPPRSDAPQANGASVSYGGKTYRFPSPAAAQAFKMEMGIK